MSKNTLRYAEFYVTNVCNLDCPQCNRFNNRSFKGHYTFDFNTYQAWSKVLDIKKTTILGGEPTLNPHLAEWILGVHQCWPQAQGTVVTNGTYLSRCRGLEPALAKTGWTLDICIHNPAMRSFVADKIFQTFGHCEVIEPLKHKSVDNGLHLRSHNGVDIKVYNGENFHNNIFSDGEFQLYDSDPVQAHSVCTMSRCHHFIQGKLYKCGVVYLLPEYFRQIGRSVPDLYDQYQPITLDTVNQTQLDALSTDPIPQCQYCPSTLTYQPNASKFKSRTWNIKVLGQQL